MWQKTQAYQAMQEDERGKKTMMDLINVGMYLGTLSIVAVFGCLFIDMIDYKSDVMAGIREKRTRKKLF